MGGMGGFGGGGMGGMGGNPMMQQYMANMNRPQAAPADTRPPREKYAE